ncbi:MAG: hypothetical protein M3R15_21800 [Acidobacteriota bacterium]|nr:hypothetical protein [Acidobacteriota bacterium]
MAWEDRNGRSYYYRKERDGDRVRSIYVGSNETASLIAQLEEMRRDEQEEGRILARMDRERWHEQEAELDSLGEMMDAVATGVLLAVGYHTHKRQWRLKRNG